MSDTRLTDAQVAALAILSTSLEAAHDPHLWNDDRDAVKDDAVQDLAIEVQQARGRRCEACESWHRASGAAGECDWLDRPTLATWFCADFAPKP
jgi:hypothetical protein